MSRRAPSLAIGSRDNPPARPAPRSAAPVKQASTSPSRSRPKRVQRVARADSAVRDVGQTSKQHQDRIGSHGDRGHKPRPRQSQGIGGAKSHGTTVRGLEHAEMPVEHQCAGGPPDQPSPACSRQGAGGRQSARRQPRQRTDSDPTGLLTGQRSPPTTGDVRSDLRRPQKVTQGPRSPAARAQPGKLLPSPALTLCHPDAAYVGRSDHVAVHDLLGPAARSIPIAAYAGLRCGCRSHRRHASLRVRRA